MDNNPGIPSSPVTGEPTSRFALPHLPAKQREQLLRRSLVPIETKAGYLATTDRLVYHRDPETGVIRRVIPKVRGKKARAADKLARRKA